MSRSLFFLWDDAWAAIAPHSLQNQPTAQGKDDRSFIFDIINLVECGGHWAHCPPDLVPLTTVYDR